MRINSMSSYCSSIISMKIKIINHIETEYTVRINLGSLPSMDFSASTFRAFQLLWTFTFIQSMCFVFFLISSCISFFLFLIYFSANIFEKIFYRSKRLQFVETMDIIQNDLRNYFPYIHFMTFYYFIMICISPIFFFKNWHSFSFRKLYRRDAQIFTIKDDKLFIDHQMISYSYIIKFFFLINHERWWKYYSDSWSDNQSWILFRKNKKLNELILLQNNKVCIKKWYFFWLGCFLDHDHEKTDWTDIFSFTSYWSTFRLRTSWTMIRQKIFFSYPITVFCNIYYWISIFFGI